MKKHQIKAFTLVELIVVITILAILSTISFVAFQNFSSNARDSVRQSTLANIQKGLETYIIKVGEYPSPDNIYGTGIFESETLLYVGEIGENITRIINLNKNVKDPTTEKNYVYGVSYNNNYYQIGTSLENIISYNPIINKTYADNLKASYVVGNYKGLLTKGSYIYNIPSLIVANTGSVSLTGTTTYYVINKGKNLVYDDRGQIPTTNSQTGREILKELTGKENLTITGITIPTTTQDEYKNNSNQYTDALGYNINDIGFQIFGNKYIPVVIKNDDNEESQNNENLEDCIFGQGNTSGSIFGECSL